MKWATVVCVASGPSLTVEDCAVVESSRATGRCRVIVVNDNWRLLPNADELYASDTRWWNLYADEVKAGFKGECWTQSREAADRFGLHYIELKKYAPGLSRDPTVLHGGGNSGYAAIGRAFFRGAKQIILLGYDLQHTGGKAHWFGNHPETFSNFDGPEGFLQRFEVLAEDLEREGIDVVNCTQQTALKCFRRTQLSEVLGETVAA